MWERVKPGGTGTVRPWQGTCPLDACGFEWHGALEEHDLAGSEQCHEHTELKGTRVGGGRD